MAVKHEIYYCLSLHKALREIFSVTKQYYTDTSFFQVYRCVLFVKLRDAMSYRKFFEPDKHVKARLYERSKYEQHFQDAEMSW